MHATIVHAGTRRHNMCMRCLQVNEISEEDYFARNAEFSTWLKEKRQLFFNDLSAEETRRLFADFVQAWNGRKLPAKYYGGLVGSSMRRTNYQWGLKGA